MQQGPQTAARATRPAAAWQRTELLLQEALAQRWHVRSGTQLNGPRYCQVTSCQRLLSFRGQRVLLQHRSGTLTVVGAKAATGLPVGGQVMCMARLCSCMASDLAVTQQATLVVRKRLE